MRRLLGLGILDLGEGSAFGGLVGLGGSEIFLGGQLHIGCSPSRLIGSIHHPLHIICGNTVRIGRMRQRSAHRAGGLLWITLTCVGVPEIICGLPARAFLGKFTGKTAQLGFNLLRLQPSIVHVRNLIGRHARAVAQSARLAETRIGIGPLAL